VRRWRRSDAIKSERSCGGLSIKRRIMRKSGARRFPRANPGDRTDRRLKPMCNAGKRDARALAIREFAALPQLIDGN